MSKKLYLTEKQLKSIPGHRTRLDTQKLKGMVASLLVEAGIDQYLMGKVNGADVLSFEMVLDTNETDVKRVVHFKLEIPQLYRKFTRKGLEPRYEEAASWRLFHDYLERKMAMVRLGISDLVEEFTANIVMSLPDGTQKTVYEAMMQGVNDPDAPLLPFVMEATQ